jgi:hypothetical protein
LTGSFISAKHNSMPEACSVSSKPQTASAAVTSILDQLGCDDEPTDGVGELRRHQDAFMEQLASRRRAVHRNSKAGIKRA